MANQLQFILVRHGESTANADETVRSQVSEHLIPLTDVGIQQAKQAGEKVRQLLTEYGAEEDQRVYYSPYLRARQTLKHMELGLSFEKIRSDARLVEINYGLDNALEGYEKKQMKKAIEKAGGRFFYRHPDGESYTDVRLLYLFPKSFSKLLINELIIRFKFDWRPFIKTFGWNGLPKTNPKCLLFLYAIVTLWLFGTQLLPKILTILAMNIWTDLIRILQMVKCDILDFLSAINMTELYEHHCRTSK
jgi:hypothetical protein